MGEGSHHHSVGNGDAIELQWPACFQGVGVYVCLLGYLCGSFTWSSLSLAMCTNFLRFYFVFLNALGPVGIKNTGLILEN